MKYTLFHTDGKARRGRIENPRGVIDTPAFMPVGTVGSVRSVSPQEVAGTGAQIILGNTFHLMLRPGTEIINLHGSLHDFMGWSGPILTDSGGFQVWSLAKKKDIREEGVTFRSPVDGSTVIALYKLFADDEAVQQMVIDHQAGGFGYGDFKQRLFDAYWEYFENVRSKREELEQNKDYVAQVLTNGAEKARYEATAVIERIRKAVGLR